jgi:hypothetical protein
MKRPHFRADGWSVWRIGAETKTLLTQRACISWLRRTLFAHKVCMKQQRYDGDR